jgi:predicted nicotinamide N-methyase
MIAGFATQIEAFELGATTIGVVCVRDLERHVDRERLLSDDGVEPPYWALVWAGARVLARHVVDNLECGDKAVLDVGCGLGLVALAAARKGARVTAVDREVAPIEFVLASAAANEIAVDALVCDVVRGDLRRRFDFVLAADLLYERPEFDALAKALAGLVAPSGVVWVADAQRVDTAPFYDAASRAGLAIQEVCSAEVREESAQVRVRLVALAPA